MSSDSGENTNEGPGPTRSSDTAPMGGTVSPRAGPTPPRPAAPAVDATPPIHLPEHDLIAKLGSGGFGEVWLARHRVLGAYRAVKLIPPQGRDELLGLRMLFERIPAHPRLCPIESVGEAGDWLYCVMPLADSATPGALDPSGYRPLTLAEHLARVGRLSARETAAIGADLADGLVHLHTHGAVHGDVKPANILRIDGQWRLADYGLLSGLERGDARGATQGYAPPEGPGTPSGDQHALGVTLHRALTGRGAASFARQREARDATSFDGVDDALEAVIWKAAAADPERRYASMGEMRDDLRAAASGGVGSLLGRAWSRARVALAAAVVAAVLAFAAVDFAVEPLIRATGLHAAYSGWLRAWSPALSDTALDRVVVIALTDDDDVEALAAGAELEGVSRENIYSHRRIHGEMARRISSSGARALVFDIFFSQVSPFDDDLVDGVKALTAAGVGTVIALRNWEVAPERANDLVGRLMKAGAAFGAFEILKIGRSPAEFWPALAVLRGADIMPSLSLSALAAWLDPIVSYNLQPHDSDASLKIERFSSANAGPRLSKLGESTTVRAGARFESDSTVGRGDFNRRAGDTCLANLLPPVPPDERLDRMTLSYSEVFEATSVDRRRMLGGRLAIIGDFRARSNDLHQVGDRMVYGAYLQALACAALLENQAPRTLTVAEMQISAALCALVGALLGVTVRARDRGWLGVAALLACGLALAGAIVLGSALAYRSTGLLIAAIPLAATLLVGAALGYLLLPVAHRLAQRRAGAQGRAVYG